jgi:DNA-directed RNA polymerase subunit M/transcription elongation factor TFIIS
MSNNAILYQLLSQGLSDIDNFDNFLNTINIIGDFENKIFNPLSFTKQKDDYDGDIDRQRRDTLVITGIVDCPKCKSNLTTSVQIQTSSGDEATKLFSRCFKCNTRWSN